MLKVAVMLCEVSMLSPQSLERGELLDSVIAGLVLGLCSCNSNLVCLTLSIACWGPMCRGGY